MISRGLVGFWKTDKKRVSSLFVNFFKNVPQDDLDQQQLLLLIISALLFINSRYIKHLLGKDSWR